MSNFLNDDAVLEVVKTKPRETVLFAGLDCNWNTNSDNTEKDYFNVWAVVNFYEKTDRVILQGARFGKWNLDFVMQFVKAMGNVGLYKISLDNQSEFPDEFVIRLERDMGERFYDNNNYRNYYLDHSKGHLATGIAIDERVISFNAITTFKILGK
ncbi:hypothetical protein AGMMS49938_09020 [Fibrobacterales bacterium]|nr:hypothetical protein AGMMS49938_09020 [Fibrobacterales bacterium]